MTSSTPKLALFCDEAGKDTDRFLAVGGVIVAHTDVARIRYEFLRRKTVANLTREAKWNSTRKPTLEKHRALIHWIFQLIQKRELLFHCILVDFERFDHDLRSDGGKAESMKRMYYQLILHRLLKKHGQTYDCYALIDKCNELKGLPRLQKGLNTAAKAYGCVDALKVGIPKLSQCYKSTTCFLERSVPIKIADLRIKRPVSTRPISPDMF